MRESARKRGKMHGLSRGASSARKDSGDECRGAGEAEAAVPMQGKARGRTICGANQGCMSRRELLAGGNA